MNTLPDPRPAKPRPRAFPRLAAIDLDGTLLGPDLAISPENRRAVARLQTAGTQVVFASGRHRLAMTRYAADLPDIRWLVSVQGAEVSDTARGRILSQNFLPPGELPQLTGLADELGLTPLFYTPDGVYARDTAVEPVRFYAHLSGREPSPVPATGLDPRAIYKVIWIGEEDRISALATDGRLRTPDREPVRTHARFLELMPPGVTKATGLETLTRHLDLTAADAVVFGDAENDVPMFEWAGQSIAMPHGWPNALAKAKRIAPPGPPESALARAVEMLFQESGK